MHQWVKEVTQALPPLANSENAHFMKSYMRGQYAFYGIQSGPRRVAVKPMFEKAQLPSIEDLPQIINELWALPEREYQMVAVDLLIKIKKKLPIDVFDDVERWITTKSWWDTVDMIATHIAGNLYLLYPNEFNHYYSKWAASQNIWLRRTCILYQLKYKTNTDTQRLFSIIKRNKSDNEFFIQKAIGWALREYSKTNADAVVQFIQTEHIQGLAKREGLKWLKSHGANL